MAAPDPVAQSDWGYEVPAAKAPPSFAHCDVCGDPFALPGDRVFEPAPFVTSRPGSLAASFWLAERGGRDATPFLTENVRASLSDPDVVWVSPSEPINITNAVSLPRALLLSADGTTVTDRLFVGPDGFALAVADGRIIDTEDALLAPLAAALPTPREGFAAAWSRTAGRLYVLGGRDPVTHAVVPSASTWEPGLGWLAVPLDPAHAPRKALAATFSPADWRVWVIDQRGPGKRHLLRINGETGHVETDAQLGALSAFQNVWLTTLEDGRVVFVGTNGAVHVVALLSSRAFSSSGHVALDGAYFGLGKVVLPPVVRFGKLSLALEKKKKGKAVGITPVVVSPGACNVGWSAVSNALP